MCVFMALKNGLDVRLLLANDDDDDRLIVESRVCLDGICVSLTFNDLIFWTKSSSEDKDETVSSPSLYSWCIWPSVSCLYNGHHVPSSPKQTATSPGSIEYQQRIICLSEEKENS